MRMPPVAVVSDTTAYLPRAVVEANDIHLVSLYVNFGAERTERESDIADFGAFYDQLRRADELPTTSQPSLGDFMEVYEPLLAEGRDIVSIHLSGGLSGTVESAHELTCNLDFERELAAVGRRVGSRRLPHGAGGQEGGRRGEERERYGALHDNLPRRLGRNWRGRRAVPPSSRQQKTCPW